MNHDYLTIDEVVNIHDIAIHEFGGAIGIRDMGALASAIMRPPIGYYDGLLDETAARVLMVCRTLNLYLSPLSSLFSSSLSSRTTLLKG